MNKFNTRTRGQALVEYALVLAFVLLALMVRVPPSNKNVMALFVDAYREYDDSFYFLLRLPFP